MFNPFLSATSSVPESSSEQPGGSVNPLDWNSFWNTIVNFFSSNVWNILNWFLTLIVGLLVIYLVVRLVRFVMRKRGVDEMAVRFVGNLVKVFLWLILIIILLALMGVPVTGLTTGFSAIVLAVGVALKDFLSHVAAGIILITSRNYSKGDYIQVDGIEGSIVNVNLLFTTLKTYDSTRITVPNSKMVNCCVTNFEALHVRRLAIHYPIPHDADLDVVRKTFLDVMASDGRIKTDPAPLCRLNAINEDSLDIFVTCYVDIEDYWDMYFYVYDQAYDALKRAGIASPYRKVHVYESKEPEKLPTKYEKLPERKEKVYDDDKIKHISLIDYDEMSPEEVAKIMAHNKKVRDKKKAAKAAKAKEKGEKKEQTKKK